MKSGIITFCLLGLAASAYASESLDSVIGGLEYIGCFDARARLAVSLPLNNDDIIYDLDIRQSPNSSDRLYPLEYLIDFTYVNAPSGPSQGFSAYFNGNHYRYSTGRLQEYHVSWDSIPFNMGAGSVQHTAQFANLLPANIARELRAMESDTLHDYRFSITRRDGTVDVGVTLDNDGETVMSRKYRFETPSMRPLSITTESNIGAISEQIVTATFTYSETPRSCLNLSEEELAKSYADAFANYRVSNFAISQLPGKQLPSFRLPRADGKRMIYNRGDALDSPTAVVLVDPTAGFADATVKALREGIAALPYPAQTIWACVSTAPMAVEELIGEELPGEITLLNARSLVSDTGAASLPVVILVGRDGRVADVVLGYNNNLAEVVIQKMSILK